ncbi:NOL1/NOP2/sun family putative RNA methylase [Candidatus Pacearchaeota archaeon]|nr:NOL1/NOP2/sun family putative RNA methylase [Candidatus Pacearchaeota archaeon]
MTLNRNYEPKPRFVERIKLLLDNEDDVNKFFEVAKTCGKKSIRVNTLKISPEELVIRLKNKGWKINQPFPHYPEIVQIDSILQPGELGKATEHILGYYYVQEITSMMPIIALQPKDDDILLDLCASPGSKTTQAAAMMDNKGTILANDLNIGRISILSANLERCSVTNTILTRHDGLELCAKLKKSKTRMKFDKILVDAPCSGEGNIRCSPRTYVEWSESLLENFGKRQKKLASKALELLKENGEMIYSTCTHSPEENESVVQYLLDNYDIKILPITLPIKTRPGISKWKNETFHPDLKHAYRIYHHDNDMEGFFLCKIKKLSDNKKGEEK